MSIKPPLLPGEILSRVLKVSQFEGRTVLWLSGTFAVLSAMQQDAVGAIGGCAAAGAGALALHGGTLLRRGESTGMDWLVRSELLLMSAILIYAGFRLGTVNLDLLQSRMTPQLEQKLGEIGFAKEDFLQLALQCFRLVYIAVGVTTFFYQGAMAFYYHRRRDPVRRALDQEHSE